MRKVFTSSSTSSYTLLRFLFEYRFFFQIVISIPVGSKENLLRRGTGRSNKPEKLISLFVALGWHCKKLENIAILLSISTI